MRDKTSNQTGPIGKTLWARRLLLVCLGLVVGLFVSEIALRLAGISYPKFYQADDERGFSQRPGMEGWYEFEGRAYVRINSDGLRDREHTKEKPPNTLRIAVLGDSYTAALQVSLEETFSSVMEARLNECSGRGQRQIEVINFGVPGYGTAQELITLRERVWQYSPDIIMLAFLPGNDVADNSRALRINNDKDVPYFLMRDGQLTLDASFRQSPAFRFRKTRSYRVGVWLRDHSRVLQALHLAYFAYTNREASPQSEASRDGESATPLPSPNSQVKVQPGLDVLLDREPVQQVWKDAWEVTERLLLQMRDDVKSKGADFLVVTLSKGSQVFPDAAARGMFVNELGISDLFYADLRIKELGKRNGFAVLTLVPELQSYAEQNQAYLHGFGDRLGVGHWNALGHRAAGEIIARRLCQDISKPDTNEK